MKAELPITISALLLTLAGNVSAHSFPANEVPSAGQSLSAPPSEVSIKFDAPIEPLFAQLQVIATDGKDQASSAPQVGADGYTLSVKVPSLAAGDYTVKWSVVCIDTHHTHGSYQFTVNRGGS
jgi:methionine-rich copper-binding protein CopC